MWTAEVRNPSYWGVKVFSDVPGQILGYSFYKALTNTGVHVVTLWDSTGMVLATQTAGAETASGKQWVMFLSPVSIAANQTVTCGYPAPNGHFSYDTGVFSVQKDVAPLHVPTTSVCVYGTQATTWPTSSWSASNYWADVLFGVSAGASSGSSTWISGAKLSTAGNTASVTWNTAVPSDSQVEYGATTVYGNTTPLDTAKVTSHAVAIRGLAGGNRYHFRLRSTLVSDAKQQFTATVSNTSNAAGHVVGNGGNGQFVRIVHGSDRVNGDTSHCNRNQPGRLKRERLRYFDHESCGSCACRESDEFELCRTSRRLQSHGG